MIVLYVILRVMVRATLRIFYKEFSVHGRERMPRKGPLLVVGNHPNTLMDPLIVASLLHQQVGFMGNGSLFRSKPLAALLRYFHVIPVYRKQDILPGENIDNQDNFEHARVYLGKGGTLLIFPEGTSFAEKKLRELRTGSARIALSYEAKHNFEGGLQILPVALNYSASTRFRTRMRADVGTPIPVAKFRDLYAQDPAAAAHALMDEVRDQLQERMIILEDKEQERLFSQILRVYREAFPAKRGKEALAAEMALATQIREGNAANPEGVSRLQARLDRWFSLIDRLQIEEGFFRGQFLKWNPWLLWGLHLVFLLLTAPIYLFGLLTSWVPYWFPAWVAPKISDEIEYHAPTMMVIGMFLFPIWYGLILMAAWIFGVGGWWLLGLAVALPAAGSFALWYHGQMERFEAIGSLLLLRSRRKQLIEQLDEQRAALLHEIAQVLGVAAGSVG